MNEVFIHSLVAEKGHEQHQEKLKPYSGLIGNWDFDWVGHEEDGSTWTVPGEWHFSWIYRQYFYFEKTSNCHKSFGRCLFHFLKGVQYIMADRNFTF